MHGLAELKGVGPALVAAFSKHGVSSVEQVASASVEELTAVPGIGQARARMLISAAAALRPEGSEPQPKAKKSRPEKAGKDKKKKRKTSKTGAKKSKKSEKKKSSKKDKKKKKGKKPKTKKSSKSNKK